MDDSDSEKRSYEVGQGKPPKHSQWKKGQSGNPGGRPKGSVSWKTVVERVLDERVPIMENGKKRRRSKRELVARAAVHAAITKNDYRGLRALGAFKEDELLPEVLRVTLKLEEDTPKDRHPWCDDDHRSEPDQSIN